MAVSNICRICMGRELDMAEMFEPLLQEIVSMIEFCTGILLQNEDDVPSQLICTKCVQDLHTSHKFKMNCIASEKAFQDLNKTNNDDKIKNELKSYNKECLIKSEASSDYDVTPASVHTSSEDLIVDLHSSINNIKKTRRVMVNSKKPSIKREKKIVARRVKIAPNDTKAKSRKGLNKFKRLYCELCQVAFSNRKESLEHRKKLHKEEKNWICEVCGKSYAHRSSQIAHMHSHYPARYACHHCDYCTYNKYDLIKHVRIHTGDKLYKCTQCTAAYRTSSNLRKHVRLMHEQTRSHACHMCGKTYNDRATLNRHFDAHNDIKRHVCEVCHSCFRRRSYWKKHLQKKHDIIIPNCRPGRPKAEVLLLDRSDRSLK